MERMQDNYKFLVKRLDEFIRKYYINQLIRGAIYTSAIILILFLSITIPEYFFRFSTTLRTFLFWGYLAVCGSAAVKFLLIPAGHYFNLGKIISYEQAAKIIGTHFREVQDKLTNILQLKQLSDSHRQKELITASIDQKIEKLKPIPIKSAINFRENRRYLKYALAPLFLMGILLLSSPNVLKESTTRLIYNGIYFAPKAPFDFEVLNDNMEVVQYEDFRLAVKVKGNILPKSVYIDFNDHQYKLRKKSNTEFEYMIVKIRQDHQFRLFADGHYSKSYTIRVLPKPSIMKFDVSLHYPEYTGQAPENLNNIGDLVVPQGSKVMWNFYTKNTESIELTFEDTTLLAEKKGKEHFVLQRQLFESTPYQIGVSNKKVHKADSIAYVINVVPDRYPVIHVVEYKDSTNKKYLYFSGEASDDYGIKRLNFNYTLEHEKPENTESFSVPISFSKGSKSSKYEYYWDLNKIDLGPGDKLVYYFEVWDNDGINGSKSSKTSLMSYKMPSAEEFEALTEANNENIKEKLDASIKDAKALQSEMKDLQDKMISKKQLSWEDKEKMKDLMKKHQALENNVEEVKDKFKENLAQQSDYKELSQEIVEKQQKLQELFDELLPDEMKQMFEKLESLMDELNKEQMLEDLEDMEFTEEKLANELDRMLELFKQLEFDNKLTDVIDKLEDLAQEEQELSEETDQKDAETSELSEKQEEIKEKFEDIKKDMEELEGMNNDMEFPKDMEDTKQDQESIQQELDNSEKALEENKKKKASQHQKGAAQKMEEMANNLQQMKNDMDADQMQVDLDAIRQILENLVKLSFDQESLMEEVKKVNINNPKYKELVQQQHKLKEDARMVQDSLFALSKRVFQIESFVNEQIANINKNLEKGIRALENRKTPQATSRQQYVMTAVNNLALMLSEAMQQMQNQMANKMPGNQNCQKPGGSSSQIPKLSNMQQQLNDQISELQQQLKDGKKPGQQGKKKMSKDLAKAAATQAAIREALQKYNQEENKDGKGSLGNLDKLMDEMEKTETDLVNKRLTEEMLKRQQEILTRLLEAADAERQREKENKRKSETAQEYERDIPPSLEEYLKKKENEIELYKTVPPDLKPLYKDLVEDYFEKISFN